MPAAAALPLQDSQELELAAVRPAAGLGSPRRREGRVPRRAAPAPEDSLRRRRRLQHRQLARRLGAAQCTQCRSAIAIANRFPVHLAPLATRGRAVAPLTRVGALLGSRSPADRDAACHGGRRAEPGATFILPVHGADRGLLRAAGADVLSHPLPELAGHQVHDPGRGTGRRPSRGHPPASRHTTFGLHSGTADSQKAGDRAQASGACVFTPARHLRAQMPVWQTATARC